jgi:GNAT superfamily N-acetyltransferase
VGDMARTTRGTGKTRPARVSIREFRPEDYPALVDLMNRIEPEYPTTVEETRYEDEHVDHTKYVLRRSVAVRPGTDEVLGATEYEHNPWTFDPDRYGVWVGVRPEAQGRGIGGALFEHILGELTERRAAALRTRARADRRETVGFLERRGFKELERTWESRLDLASYDPTKFQDRGRVPEGIAVTTLAEELARDPEALRRLHELNDALSPDVPRIDPYTSMTFESFRDMVTGPGYVPEACFLAKDGDRWIGMSNIFRSEAEPAVLYTGFTATRREYRGKGIAWALKVRAVGWAKAGGYRELRTWNSTLNAPMLSINVRLGFVKQPAWITFGRDLAREG